MLIQNHLTEAFDEWNRLATVTDGDGDVTTYTYNGIDNLIRTEFANGILETRRYDDLGRLRFLENRLDGTTVSSYDYTLNLNGSRVAVQEQDGRRVDYKF